MPHKPDAKKSEPSSLIGYARVSTQGQGLRTALRRAIGERRGNLPVVTRRTPAR